MTVRSGPVHADRASAPRMRQLEVPRGTCSLLVALVDRHVLMSGGYHTMLSLSLSLPLGIAARRPNVHPAGCMTRTWYGVLAAAHKDLLCYQWYATLPFRIQ